MPTKPKLLFIFITTFLLTNSLFAQKAEKTIAFNQKDLMAYKTDHHVYNFWLPGVKSWSNTRSLTKGDTLTYYTNEKEYKGLTNYGVDCFSVDKTRCSINELFRMFFLDVEFQSFKFNVKDSTVNIKGSVTGGWTKNDHIWVENESSYTDKNNVNVSIGQKKDTLSKLYIIKNTIKHEDNVFYKKDGKEVISPVVLDSFSSFYLNNYKKYRTKKGSNREFEITAKVSSNSILTFGLQNCYTEIFEIGKLVFDTEKVRAQKRKASKVLMKSSKSNDDYFKYIIRNNVQELYKDTISKPEKSWYYKVTENAEDYIIKRQYGNAKKEYIKFLDKDQYMFARDLHNAVRATTLSRDYKTAVIWCEKLSLKGIPLSYFDNQIFNKLRKTSYWNDFLIKYPKLREQYQTGLNQNLIDGLEALIQLDQKDYARQAKGEFDRAGLFDTTERVNDGLLKLLKTEGFPTEEKIGIKMKNDSIPETSPKHMVLIYHAHQNNGTRLSEIKEILANNSSDFGYDATRSNLSEMMNMGTCLMLYKGDLYNDKTCYKANKKQVALVDFSFNNKFGFIVDEGEFSILGYNKENEKADIQFIKEHFNFIKKITNDWFKDYEN